MRTLTKKLTASPSQTINVANIREQISILCTENCLKSKINFIKYHCIFLFNSNCMCYYINNNIIIIVGIRGPLSSNLVIKRFNDGNNK